MPLHGDRREPLQNLSEVLEHYMLQSEQLDTRLILAADDQVAAGLLIQRLPVKGEHNLESGLPESFNVLIKELQSLCLNVELVEGPAAPGGVAAAEE